MASSNLNRVARPVDFRDMKGADVLESVTPFLRYIGAERADAATCLSMVALIKIRILLDLQNK